MEKVEEKFCAYFKWWVDSKYTGTKTDLAELLCISPQQLSNVLAGRRCGDETWRRTVATKLGLVYEEMIGENFKKCNQAEIIRNMIQIPVYNAGSGEPSSWTDQGYPTGFTNEYTLIPKDGVDKNTFGVKIHGESMAPNLNEGDIVVVVPSAPLVNGKLCFATWLGDEGDCLVKRYYRYGDTVVLKSDNPAPEYEDIELTPKNSEEVRIYRVTISIRKE